MSFLSHVDPEVSRIIEMEEQRHRETINLYPSENYASKAVLEAQGSSLTTKYSSGYPGRRDSAACEVMDLIENLAIQRAKELFHAEHANVQSFTGTTANMAVYFGLLNLGDIVLAMSPAHGAHPTHGAEDNFSAKLYNFVHYGVRRDTERIDYEEAERLALECKPKLIIAGASAYSRIIDFECFRHIADKVGALLMVDMAHISGLICTGLHPDPVPYADVITSTTHKSLRGTRSAFILCKKELAEAIDRGVYPELIGGPMMHIVAAKAVTFLEAMQPSFAKYQQAILDNAQALASEFIRLGMRLVSGGTDNHLMTIDLTKLGVDGMQAREALHKANIVANRCAMPYGGRNGLRIGLPPTTSRGFGVEEMKPVAAWVVKILNNIDKPEVQKQVKEEVLQLCQRFPIPGIDY